MIQIRQELHWIKIVWEQFHGMVLRLEILVEEETVEPPDFVKILERIGLKVACDLQPDFIWKLRKSHHS